MITNHCQSDFDLQGKQHYNTIVAVILTQSYLFEEREKTRIINKGLESILYTLNPLIEEPFAPTLNLAEHALRNTKSDRKIHIHTTIDI